MLFAFNLPLANQIFEESEGRVQDRLIIKAKHWTAKPEYADKGETNFVYDAQRVLVEFWYDHDAEDYNLQA